MKNKLAIITIISSVGLIGICRDECLTQPHAIQYGLSPYNKTEADSNTLSLSDKLPLTDIREYFCRHLSKPSSGFDHDQEIALADVESVRGKIWEIWRETVNNSDSTSERLPLLSSHEGLRYWEEVHNPDGIWELPDGEMKFFYGSKGAKSANGYPLFIFLHGSGPEAHEEWLTTLAWAGDFKDGPSAYFIPESPRGGRGCRWYQPSRQLKWENILRQVMAGEDIDPDRIYFAGISEGAYGSQRLASFYSDYLAGAGSIAGGEQTANCPPENLANLAFYMAIGEHDTAYARNLLAKRVTERLDSLATAHPGYYTHMTEFQPDKGHGCDYTTTTPWLATHSRNPYPHYFYWENTGLGLINGEPLRYRDCFYNLSILEPSDNRADSLYRSVYEMKIDSNVVELKVSNVKVSRSERVSDDFWEMDIGVEKLFSPATEGKVRIYLNSELVNLSRPVKIIVNGQEKYNGPVSPSLRDMVESCALFYDPRRVFTASVAVSVN